MKPEEELNLLRDYMNYFINLRFAKEEYIMKKREWDGKGPGPRLNVRSERELEPISFKDWQEELMLEVKELS